MVKDDVKIFGLGFHKTGSTTLETALITLGYNATGRQDQLFEAFKTKRWSEIETVVSQYDAFRDMPWPLFYQELDQHFPNSKFILTIRNTDSWIQSCKNHYKNVGFYLFENIYGKGNHYPVGKEDIWLERYSEHNHAVKEYFRDQPDKFLVVNWENGDDWEKLCKFLQKPVPNRKFPHANKGRYTFVAKAMRRIHYLLDKEGFKRRNRDL